MKKKLSKMYMKGLGSPLSKDKVSIFTSLKQATMLSAPPLPLSDAPWLNRRRPSIVLLKLLLLLLLLLASGQLEPPHVKGP
jgi:hypothetical protein